MEELTLKPLVPTECAPAAHLYVAIPAYTGSVCTQTLHSLVGGLELLRQAGVKVTTNFVAGCCYLDHTRNLLVKSFLESEATDLLFVDSDVGFEPVAPVIIAAAKRPLVAGVYPKKGSPVQWPVTLPGSKFNLHSDGTIQVPLMPTGFMRVNRKVFEVMAEAPGLIPRYKDRQVGDVVGFFHCEIRENLYWGEDYQFCADWNSLGGECWVIPDMSFNHTGIKTWDGNFMEWIREKASSVKLMDDPGPGAEPAPEAPARSSAA